MQAYKVIEHITDWLTDYAERSHTKGYVVGISGGIDSAVTSYLCALTGKPTVCVFMPIHQEPTQLDRAHKHIEQLQHKFSKITTHTTDLTQTYETMTQQMPTIEASEELKQLTDANTRARLRMSTLYYIAGMHQYLVAGTGNKVEDFGIGFFTKYGDGGVDISPIADLNKSQVFELAKALGVIQDIIIAPPTDGLFGDSRTDEQQIGASYPELEWAMEFDKKQHEPLSDRQQEVLEIYKRLNTKNQHKMNPIPVCEIPKKYL